MGRTKGLVAFSGNYEPQSAEPLDGRMVVGSVDDLILTETWQAKDESVYTYIGMLVTVKGGSTYTLRDADYTDIDNWRDIGASPTSHLNLTDVAQAGLGVTQGHVGTGVQTFYGKKTLDEMPVLPANSTISIDGNQVIDCTNLRQVTVDFNLTADTSYSLENLSGYMEGVIRIEPTTEVRNITIIGDNGAVITSKLANGVDIVTSLSSDTVIGWSYMNDILDVNFKHYESTTEAPT